METKQAEVLGLGKFFWIASGEKCFGFQRDCKKQVKIVLKKMEEKPTVKDLKVELKNMRICRFCLNRNEPLTNIYSIENRLNRSVPLPLQIMACVAIEVSW